MKLEDFCRWCNAECCKTLILKEDENIFGIRCGLLLFPEEVSVLKRYRPGLEVYPLDGFGYGKTVRVVATYQLPYNVCPFLKNNRCTIYENRPTACRAYPLVLRMWVVPSLETQYGELHLTSLLKAVVDFESRCPFSRWIREIVGTKYLLTKEDVKRLGIEEEVNAVGKIVNYLRDHIMRWDAHFRYDLLTHKWVRLR